MVYTESYINEDSRLVSAGIARKIPEKIHIAPYHGDKTIKDYRLTAEEHTDKCNAELHAFLAVLCKKIQDCGEKFAIHEENGTADIILLQDEQLRLENLKKIMAILSEFPARWLWAEVQWNSVEMPEAAEQMAGRIVDALHDQYVHIGNRVGKLEKNDQGEIIFKKRFSKHYGFKIQPMDLCKEYLINHKHFKRGGIDGAAFADLSEVSYWR